MKKTTFIFMLLSVLLNAQTDTFIDTTTVIGENNYLGWFNYPSFFIGLGIGLMLLYYSYYQKKSIKYTIPLSKTNKRDRETGGSWGAFFDTFNEQPEADKLYDKLRKKIHPDRFPNDKEKIELATRLSSELGDNKIHLSRLKEIAIEAKENGLI
tara:strand:- start:1070 stop:1531 length:462 start_codon:yes stop_codon:yes gene_type:complete